MVRPFLSPGPLAPILLVAAIVTLPVEGRLGGSASQCLANEWTVGLDLNGRRLEGMPVAYTQQEVLLLGRDGYLWDFSPDQAKNFGKVSDGFRPLSQGELRAQLLREFGRGFEVSGTGHYLVVHPAGQRDRWAQRFEDLYRSFVHYFSVRGFRPQQPLFPLVAVVFPSQADFQRYALKTDNVRVASGVLGYYSPTTNRVLLFDSTGGQSGAADEQWFNNADTIIHEATHQTAFNTGIHTRFAPQPRWLAEGLATMFEAPGVWNSTIHRNLEDRINRGRLESFRRYLERRPADALPLMISGDRAFQRDPQGAYADAWALNFFLSETRPRKYCDYLAKVAARPPQQAYTGSQRLADFTDTFGTNLPMLDAHLLRMIGELK